jgi:hypothetical protein
MSSLSNQGTPSPDNFNDASSSTSTANSEPQKRQHGPSEYELRQAANIAENKRLLASLGLDGGTSAILGKRKKGEKGKAKGYVFLFCTAYRHPSMI